MTRDQLAERQEVVTLGREVLRFSPDTPVGERIAAVSDAQFGPIDVGQLRRCGLSADAASRRVAAGLLHRLHRGVYVPGHRCLTWRGHVAAALLACGRGASACGRTAARLRMLRQDSRVLIDGAVRSATGRRAGGIITHSGRNLRPRDVEVVDGIPCTSVARTLLDCAPSLRRRGTEQAVIEADRLGTFDLRAIHDLLAHVPGHPGRAILRDAVEDAAGARGQTASQIEDDLRAEFRSIGLDEPESNPPVLLPNSDFVYPDFLWRAGALVVEADPRGTHDTTASHRSDRVRDRRLDAIGLQTMRFHDVDLRDLRACALETRERLILRRGQGHEFVALSATNS